MKPVLALSLTLVLGACTVKDLAFELPFGPGSQGMPQTRELSTPIPTARGPMLPRLRSMQVQSLLDGETSRLRISRFGNGIRVREPDGCTLTRSHDWFAPSDSFARCGTSQNWHTATATVRRDGSLFPLKLGNRVTYERRATSWNGRTSARTTECEVTDTVEVLRPGGGTTPAFVVACDDGRIVRTTWYAPGKGPIAYREQDNKQRVRDAWLRID